jgi:hypothetical protein
VPVVTGEPEGTRVFPATTRSRWRVVQRVVCVYITRPGSLLAVEDLRTGPASPVSETPTFAAAALAKRSS